ncbi:hypothetical protein DFJ74DRAFT_432194 [Hyaloraphidium curvatum]|nr:hypothetical protein DFJ74DRAFT_432194 [Hyaloraphidium curvatum]
MTLSTLETNNTFCSTVQQLGYIIKGPIPMPPANTTLGEQIINYDCIGDPSCAEPTPASMTNITRVSQLASYTASLPYARNNVTGQPIPEAWMRMGIYLHQLADRASHYYCADPRATAIYKASSKVFRVTWSPRECNFVFHGNQHAWCVNCCSVEGKSHT